MSSKRTGNQEPRVRLEPDRRFSDGGDAADMAACYGLTPFPWQRSVLETWLGRDAHDKFTATTCGLAVPRQNGKNAVVEMRELYGLTCIGERILHTAHEVRTAKKAFQRLAGFFDNEREYPELAGMVASIRRTNGEEAITLNNGASIEFSARSRKTARGFTVDLVVFDEAQELTDEQLEAIMSTMSAAPLGNRQIVYTGTPPGPGSPGEVFARVRELALAGDDDRLSWHEWSVDSIGDTSDRDRWYEANPSMGYLLDEGFTDTERKQLSEDGFARERLGWWAGGLQGALVGHDEWARLATDDPPADGRLAYGVKFSPDGATVALAVALRPADGVPYVELIDHRSMRDGISWLAEWLAVRRSRAAVTVVDGRSNADELVAQLREAGVPRQGICVPKAGDVIASATRFLAAIREGRVSHFAQPALDECVERCRKRPIGGNGGWGWGGIGDIDSSPVEAVSLAYWGVMTTKRDPARKVRLV